MKRFFLIVMLFLSACSSRYSFPFPSSPSRVFESIAEEICPDQEICKNSVVIVPDFVDLDTMQPGDLGFLFSEYLKGALVKVCGCEIYAVELRRNLKLDERGLLALTRDVSELKKKDFYARWAVIGTYREEKDSVVVFVRLVDLATGKIKRFATRRLRM